MALGATAFSAKSYEKILGANERVVMACIGLRGRGKNLLESFSGMYKDGVMIKTLCDVDSEFLGERVKLAADRQDGNKPGTEVDMRKVFDDPEIDAVAIATPTTGTRCPPSGPARRANMFTWKNPAGTTFGKVAKW